MYAITKLSKESQDFIGYQVSNNKSRSLITSLALGKVLADRLSLPSTPVDDIGTYYRQSSATDYNTLLSDVNELLILDIQAVNDSATKFYMNRYYNAHPAAVTIAINAESAIPDFFSISRSFDKTTLSLIAENCVCLTDSVSKFKRLVSELQGAVDGPQ
jgi:hypothetical protein